MGRKKTAENTLRDYVDFLKSTIDHDLKGLKIAVDCANGASTGSPGIVRELEAQVFAINDCPDGNEHKPRLWFYPMSQLMEYVKSAGPTSALHLTEMRTGAGR